MSKLKVEPVENPDDEDYKLKEELQMLIDRLNEPKQELYLPALQTIKDIIRSSTTSITSVPKPLKYMKVHYSIMKIIYKKLINANDKSLCADIISVLAMTSGGEHECIIYRLLSDNNPSIKKIATQTMYSNSIGFNKDILESCVCDWGHDYVRFLSSEIVFTWIKITESDKLDDTFNIIANDINDFKEKLIELVRQIIPYTLKHNAEAEACDLLMEIDKITILDDYIDETTYSKISLYLSSCVPYVHEPENLILIKFLLKLAKKFNAHIDKMKFAMILNDYEEIHKVFHECPLTDVLVKKQLALMLGKQRVRILSTNPDIDDDLNEKLFDLITNSHLNSYFLNLGRDLDILAPKSPEDIYKTNFDNNNNIFLNFTNRLSSGGIDNHRSGSSSSSSLQLDSAKNNLASSFVNGFINAGFGVDKMFLDHGSRWIYKNKNHGMVSATASLGLIKLWDVDGGLAAIDKYLYSMDVYIKAGALLACGICNCGISSDVEPAHAILSDYLQNDSKHIAVTDPDNKTLPNSDILRISAILGIAIAYAGTNNYLALGSLRNMLEKIGNEHKTIELIGMTGLAIGMISVGNCNSIDSDLLFQQLIWINESGLGQINYSNFLILGIALLYLGSQEKCETILETLQILDEPLRQYVNVVIEMCAYAGTGNVLKIQRYLYICSENSTRKKGSLSRKSSSTVNSKTKDGSKIKFDCSSIQMAAVIGVALVSMGEEVGTEMAFRTYGNLMRYGEQCIRRTVPLAIALSSISNPRAKVVDMLHKFSHDNEIKVVGTSIFAIGLVGAGTNNARIALMLRHLAQYYSKDGNNLFMVRIAQGLVHMGKGTVTLSPYHFDRQILRPLSLAGLLAVIFTAMHAKTFIFSSAHYLLYLLVPAIEPRWLVTLDENLNQIQVPVRVGIAVDVVAQAGKPKTITGFQTHTTPVLLSAGERAELGTEEYVQISPILEGLVILKKNINYNRSFEGLF